MATFPTPVSSVPPVQHEELGGLRARSEVYDRALRGSRISVFTQDNQLRYTVVSGPLFGHESADVLGRDDRSILPTKSGNMVVALKREVLASGQPQDAEVAIGNGSSLRWYELHLEPLRSEDNGDVAGISGVSIDITERKEGEAHLRLLMRELTHRSKNLLAVIQAMARQTARHAGSTGAFLEQFSARLQALSASHDLLAREGWHGASLTELIRSQIALHFGDNDNVRIEGPSVSLKPEAAQGLGLALHELAANAVKHGALSVSDGEVSITWRTSDEGMQFLWEECHGPAVKPRRRRGFGSLVIEHNLVRALNADVNWNFKRDGVRCEIALPFTQLLPAL